MFVNYGVDNYALSITHYALNYTPSPEITVLIV